MTFAWFRMYNEVVDDPKVQRLPLPLFRAWINCLCLASSNGGDLPAPEDVAYKLRMSESKAAITVADLVNAELFDLGDDGRIRPHNWSGRQFKSDNSTERVKRFRNVTGNVPATPDETHQNQNRTETESEQSKTTHSPPLPDKIKFGRFRNVLLTADQYEELLTKFGGDGAANRIEALSEYLASKRVSYKSHYAVILMWERKNGAKHNGNMDKGVRNAETARRLLSRLHSQDSGSMPRDIARSNTGGLSRASAEALFTADPDGHQSHD